MKKRMLAIILSFAMVMSVAPIQTFAEGAMDGTSAVEETDTATFTTLTDDTIQTTGSIPEDVTLTTTEIPKSDIDTEELKEKSGENALSEMIFAYDITLQHSDDSEWQPSEGETIEVTLDTSSMDVKDGEKVVVLHEDDNGNVESLGSYAVEDDILNFETTGFSKFYGYIVDFEYNGLKVSIDGGSEIMLSELMDNLEIARDVSAVTNVTFSNPSLINVEKVENDWKLTSLSSFGSEEWLTIHFNDGTEIKIKVTDPVLFYYLDGTNWCMDTFENEISGTKYISNSTAIVGSSLGATHEAGTADVIIYARPGMAIRFDRYSDFRSIEELDSSNGYISKDGLWRWVSAVDLKPDPADVNVEPGHKSHNFAILANDITEVKETTFTAKIGDHGDAGTDYVTCEIKIVIVPDSEQPTLLKDALQSDSTPENIKNTYSIKELPVTLYNYDGNKYKAKYSSGGNFFSFKGVSKGVDVTIDDGNLTGIGNANGGGPVLGILESTLQGDEKLPVMVQGQNVDLFSSQEFDGKEVRNVQFEFIYDTEGYYTYSSNINHAQLSDDKTKVELYREAMGTTANYALNGASPNYAAGGFYPYSDIRKAADSAGTVLDWDTWEARLADGYIKEPAPFGMDLVNSATKTQPYSTVDMHNGLQLAAKFYLPADKMTPTDEEIVYQFTGDDDLWVFIDDQLVLDIGGGHGPVSGSINFTTGAISVTNDDGKIYTIGSTTGQDSYSNNITFEGDMVHSLKIFYLERYAGVSNCRMRFNIPIIPDGAILVSKELLNEDGEDSFAYKPDKDYTFTVYTAADDDDTVNASDEKFIPLANTSYSIVGTDLGGKTDAKGNFTLKSGQTAQFEGISHFNEVYVVENEPNDGYVYTNPKVSINGGERKTYNYGEKTDTMVMPDGTLTFSFSNYMEVSDLTITKDVLDSYQVLEADQTYSLNVNLYEPITTGEAQPESSAEYTFMLKDGESNTIENIPTNMTYTLVEDEPVAPSGYEFKAPTYGDGVNEEGINDDVALSWENIKLVEDDSVIVTNETLALYGDLKITKSGISDLDNHEKDGNNKEEKQSTVYHVYGTSDSGTEVDLEVIIVGNDFITIKNVPVGTYTIEEKESWSWRYDADDAEKEASVVGGKTEEVSFSNTRQRIYWLSGDNYLLNLFTKISQ